MTETTDHLRTPRQVVTRHALWVVVALFGVIAAGGGGVAGAVTSDGEGVRARPRVLVSTDIGGTDPDDFQSMVHLLVCADVLEIEGLVSSPFGAGRTDSIAAVVDCYARDHPNLKTYSERYPGPDELRALIKQGEKEVAPYAGFRRATEGSDWIVRCARREDPRPLHVLVWGGIEDLAQALHDAPDILPKLRVYYIGGPNKKWGPDAYHYLVTHHPELWIIENNSTYRGWFNGGNQSGEWGNREFVRRHITGHGALGDFFASRLAAIKMGDTPSVAWLLGGTPGDPSKPGWGGQFVRAWHRPLVVFDRLPTTDDRMETFGLLEIALPLVNDRDGKPDVRLVVDNQEIPGHLAGDRTVRFRFSPKEAKTFTFKIRGNVPSLAGRVGGITVIPPAAELLRIPSAKFPNWWVDDPSPDQTEGAHQGARSVNRWRVEYLRDFAARMDRCLEPAAKKN